jgi:hypothetical protein
LVGVAVYWGVAAGEPPSRSTENFALIWEMDSRGSRDRRIIFLNLCLKSVGSRLVCSPETNRVAMLDLA